MSRWGVNETEIIKMEILKLITNFGTNVTLDIYKETTMSIINWVYYWRVFDNTLKIIR
jgi:hypothetical protein